MIKKLLNFFSKKHLDVSRVNRLEVIFRGRGRGLVTYFDKSEWMIQDKGKTLKVFVEEVVKDD